MCNTYRFKEIVPKNEIHICVQYSSIILKGIKIIKKNMLNYEHISEPVHLTSNNGPLKTGKIISIDTENI
jgi:hypothetical protein